MEFKELIEKRRSIRGFAETDLISTEDIKEIIADAQMAPSWKNSQTARYYVANSANAVSELTKALPQFNQASSANAALVVTTFVKDVAGFTAGSPDNELSNKWGAYDLGLNNAYFVLAAKEKGYDTLIMGIRDANEIRNIMNIPKTEQITAVIAVGKAKVEPGIPPRKSVDEVTKMF